jgi:hypothetical protein
MEMTASPSSSTTFCGLLRRTRNVSTSSEVTSPTIVMVIVCDVSPGANWTVPLAAPIWQLHGRGDYFFPSPPILRCVSSHVDPDRARFGRATRLYAVIAASVAP